MEEETGKNEGEALEVENTEKVTYACNSCDKKTNTGYFYCEECHRKHRKTRQERMSEVQSKQKEEVSEVV